MTVCLIGKTNRHLYEIVHHTLLTESEQNQKGALYVNSQPQVLVH